MLITDKKRIYKKYLKGFFFASLFILLFGPLFSHGQVGLSVSPQKFDLTVFPGTTENVQVRVRNDSQGVLPITASAVPFGARQGSGQMQFKEKTPTGPQTWVSFQENNFILKPGEEKRVNLQVKVPKEVNPGGYYLFVYFEPRVSSSGNGNTGPRVIPIIGVPFLISTTELTLEDSLAKKADPAEITRFSVDEKSRNSFLERQINKIIAFAAGEPEFYVTKKMPGKFLVTVKNNDLYHIVPEGELTVYNEDKKIGSGKLVGETILPGSSRQFEVNLNEKEDDFWTTGNYSAVLDMQAGSPVRKEIISKSSSTLSFFNFPYYFWIIIFLTFLAAVFFLTRIKFIFNRFKVKAQNS